MTRPAVTPFTFYTIYNIKVNPFFHEDLSKPNLEGYRQIKFNETTKAEVSK